MDDELKELLRNAYIPEIEWNVCLIIDGLIFRATDELTAQEVYDKWLEDNKIDNCLEPTPEERITKLEEEKSILAENVYQLATILEVMLGGTESGQTETTTTDTAN